jgi:predicted RND superfamily exporter protein
MQQFWSRLAVFLGKRLGVVILVTLILVGLAGLGIGRLKFATGQDAYLNSDERVAIDNKEYQDLFGGQAMLTVIKMDKGHTIAELFDAEGRAKFEKVKAEVKKSPFVKGVVTPARRDGVHRPVDHRTHGGGRPGAAGD